MKTTGKSILLTSVASLTFAMILAQPLQSQAATKDTFQYNATKAFVDTGDLPAKGSVKLSANEQGKADSQKLDVTVTGLNTNAPYQLVAVVNNDTNLVSLADFVTDSKGGATFQFQNSANGNSGSNNSGNVTANTTDTNTDTSITQTNTSSRHGTRILSNISTNTPTGGKGTKGGGKNKLALPDGVNPVTLITEVAVLDPNSTNDFPAVVTADMTQPDKLQYMIKRDISANGVTGSLQIKATTTKTQFRLTASGLTANSDYQVVLNGTPVQTSTTDSKGKLDVKSLQQTPSDILSVQSVELWDVNNNVILSTTLP